MATTIWLREETVIAIHHRSGRFNPYPHSLRTTTISWGLSAMQLSNIRHSRIANGLTRLNQSVALVRRPLPAETPATLVSLIPHFY